MTQGERFKTLREKANLSQRELSEKLHITPQAISRWENDLSEPNMDTIKSMSSLYNISIDAMFKDDVINE